jgi:hypothetical protein
MKGYLSLLTMLLLLIFYTYKTGHPYLLTSDTAIFIHNPQRIQISLKIKPLLNMVNY